MQTPSLLFRGVRVLSGSPRPGARISLEFNSVGVVVMHRRRNVALRWADVAEVRVSDWARTQRRANPLFALGAGSLLFTQRRQCSVLAVSADELGECDWLIPNISPTDLDALLRDCGYPPP